MSGVGRNNETIRITSFPRVHITLIGMNSGGYRINGSIGFSISNPEIDIYYEVSDIIKITDEREKVYRTRDR